MSTRGRWIAVVGGGCAVLGAAALAAWFAVPRWAPEWTLAHSPFLEPMCRAEATHVGEWLDGRVHQAIWKRGARAVPTLLSFLSSSDCARRRLAFLGLEVLPPDIVAAQPNLCERITRLSIEDPDVRVRASATSLLASVWPFDEVLPALRVAMHDPNDTVRLAAMRGLAEQVHATLLREDFSAAIEHDASAMVRAMAVTALCRAYTRDRRLTLVLLRAAQDSDPRVTAAVQEALFLKVSDLTYDERAGLFDRVLDSLRDDGIRNNATRSLVHLSWNLPHDAELGLSIEALLTDPDYQARQLAATILRRWQRPPTPALVLVTIEGLAHDRLPYGNGGTNTPAANASEGLAWLIAHREVDDAVAAALAGGRDSQTDFCCAVVLGVHQRSDYTALVAPVLIRHLADNQIPGDACLAIRALYRLGPVARPQVDVAITHADAQAKRCLDLIVRDWDDPPRDAKDAAKRGRRLPDIAEGTFDPAWSDFYEQRTSVWCNEDGR